jgi:hypothetical protein
MTNSALIDLVGVRELAAEDPARYIVHASNFRAVLERVFAAQRDSRVYFFRDHCYVTETTAEILLSLMQRLRRELLLHAQLHVRAAVTAGDIGATIVHVTSAANLGVPLRKRGSPAVITQSTPIITGYWFNQLAAKLFGDLEALKGIGISLDFDPYPNSAVHIATMENYFITEGRARRYHGFRDLRLDDSSMDTATLNALLRNFRESRASSKKVARFFVPPLVNWARSMSMVPGAEPTLDKEVVFGRLNPFRDVTGIELVYLTLVDRIYSADTSSFDGTRVAALKGFFLSAKWIHALLRSHDNNTAPIPRAVLSNSSRRAFITEVANYERGAARRPANEPTAD